MTDEFKHYGILRKSGRYAWGSGGDEYRRSMDFYAYVDALKRKILGDDPDLDPKNADREIAKLIGLEIKERTGDTKGFGVADLRDTRTIAKEEKIAYETHHAKQLAAKGWSVDAIHKNLGIPISTVRLRLAASENLKKSSLRATAEALRSEIDKYDIVDVGKAVNLSMGISPERLRAAMSVLRDEGYETWNIPQRIVGTNNTTKRMVAVKPGTGFGGARRMGDRVHTMGVWSDDDGQTFMGLHPPMSISSKRVKVVFDEDGGSDRDGLIYVRPDVPDLDMGKNNYAQVRIKINDSHFLKGVAILEPKIPDGVDLVFHTNKKRAVGDLGAMKPLESDPENPFGSYIKRQIVGTNPKTGKEELKSAMNLLTEEGEWGDWRNSLPSQMLAKQPHSLIKSQLTETRKQVSDRLDEINKITNPIIRRKKLEDYADQIDSDAVELRAAAMPHQKTKLIIPLPKIDPGQIYAPDYESGESVVLIRYPHGGRFEIPEVVVNNNNREAKRLLGNAPDAIGIHPKVAEKLSGADFDGDTVVVIPNPKGIVKGLKTAENYYEAKLNGFNPKELYGGYEKVGEKVKKDGTVEEIGNYSLMKSTGKEMGVITNLITDMSVQGASPEHIVRAVKHSMVVIDAEKHKLNYKQSAIDNGIKQLITEYQTVPGKAKPGGAATLLSKATASVKIPERKLRPAAEGGPIDKKTGELVYVETGSTRNLYDPKTKTFADGKDGRPLIKIPKLEESSKLALTNDARSLVQDPNNPVERSYAEHANAMKELANSARLMADSIPNPPQNKQAKVVYKDEIDKLTADVKEAQKQKPLDRRAQNYAAITVKQKRAEDPLLRTDRERLKKVERRAVEEGRARLGLKRPVIEVTDTQWDAIQSGGVSANLLKQVLEYADPKRIETLSMPRTNTVMTMAVSSRAKAMLAAGNSTADVARALGIAPATLSAAVKRGDL